MADEIDQAQDRIEGSIATALAMIKTTPEAEATGFCLNCGEKLTGKQRWCDVSCRNDWVARKG